MYKKWKNPTEYSNFKIEEYKKIIVEGEALTDLEDVITYGVTTESKLDYYLWETIKFWFDERPKYSHTMKEIELMMKTAWRNDPNPLKPKSLDITRLYHRVNSFTFIGALRKIDGSPFRFIIEGIVLRRGLEWFRIGNKYMKGLFQSEYGFFNIM